MDLRQNRCPFFLLKITPKDLDYITKSKIKLKILNFYDKQINSLNHFLMKKEPLSFEEDEEKSFLNKKTKRSTLSLIKKEQSYCKGQIEKKQIIQTEK